MNLQRIKGVAAKTRDDANKIIAEIDDLEETIDDIESPTNPPEEIKEEADIWLADHLSAIYTTSVELRDTVANAALEEFGLVLE